MIFTRMQIVNACNLSLHIQHCTLVQTNLYKGLALHFTFFRADSYAKICAFAGVHCDETVRRKRMHLAKTFRLHRLKTHFSRVLHPSNQRANFKLVEPVDYSYDFHTNWALSTCTVELLCSILTSFYCLTLKSVVLD